MPVLARQFAKGLHMAESGAHAVTALMGHWPYDGTSDAFGLPAVSDSDVASMIGTLKVLAVGAGVSREALARSIPTLRMASPGLAIVGLSLAHEDCGWADFLVNSPQELSRVLNEVSADLRTRSLSGHVKRAATFVFSLALLVMLWALVVWLFTPAPYLLPSPARVAEAFSVQPLRFAMHAAVTALESIAGFLLGNILGIGLAILLCRYMRIRSFTMPVLISLQAIPIVAFAPLLSVWLGTGYASKVAMAAVICFFPMVVNALEAFANVQQDYVDLFRLYRTKFGKRLSRLLLPASAPAIFSALQISAGLSVVGAIVAEMTGADKGLGFLILNGAYRLETDVLFVAMVLSGAVGISFYYVVGMAKAIAPRAWRRAFQEGV